MAVSPDRTPGVPTSGSLTKADVGLSNVDNTADVDKPVSTAQAAADGLRVLKAGDTMTGALNSTQATSGASSLATAVTGDTQKRLIVDAAGKLLWGSGAAVGDTNLYRSAADNLATDDRVRLLRNASGYSLEITNPQASGDAIVVNLGTATRFALLAAITTDVEYRLKVSAAGKFEWGDGTVIDTNLYRSGADQLATDDQLNILRNATLQSIQLTNGHATGEGLWITLGTASRAILKGKQVGDAQSRIELDADGALYWGPGATGPDASLQRTAAAVLSTDSDFRISTAGKGLRIKEGSNAKMGVATLVAGTVTVANTSVTANSRIFLTIQSLGTVADPKPIAVTARTAATSFTIRSADATDTSVVAWQIIEPG